MAETTPILARIASNWKAGVTVALVSLPLSISLGVAAGATPQMGVITAIWAGLMAALFGGSHFNIVGPTGALSGILATYVLLHGVATLPALAILSGAMIAVVYLLRWEQYLVLIPSSAIHGFTLGVAFIIALNQLNFALGLTNLPVHERFILNIFESFRHLGHADLLTIGLFLIGTAFLFLWTKRFPYIPGPIILAPIGIAIGYFTSVSTGSFHFQTLFTKFGDISSSIAIFTWPSLAMLDRSLVVTALTVTIVAILETLISAKIADGMTGTRHNPRREVLGLSLANIASGFLGGIPATAALARTALNVKSAANHRTSALINSVCVAIISLVLLPWFKFLPLAVVAAILVYVAVRMVEKEHFLHLYHYDKTAFGLSLLVAAITVIEDPIVGILVGAAVALLIFVRKFSKAESEVTIYQGEEAVHRVGAREISEVEHKGDVLVYRLAGELTYINAQSHLETVRRINGSSKVVILSFRNLFFIDIDGLDGVEEIIETLQAKGKTVALSGINSLVLPLIKKSSWSQYLQKQGLVFESSSEAILALRSVQAAVLTI